jgi:hypothetical protein
LLVQPCTSDDSTENEFDIALEGITEYNAANEFKLEQKEKPAMVFLDKAGEFLDYGTMLPGAKMQCIAIIDLWSVQNKPWTARVQVKSVTMLENGQEGYQSKKEFSATPKRKVEEVPDVEESAVVMPKRRKD